MTAMADRWEGSGGREPGKSAAAHWDWNEGRLHQPAITVVIVRVQTEPNQHSQEGQDAD